MLNIHFGPEDLGRVHVAPGPDPAWEILLSLHRLRSRNGAPAFARWREQTLAGLDAPTRMLLQLAPPRGYSPDFLTPEGGSLSVEGAVERIRSTDRHRVRRDLGQLGRERRLPLWARPLAAEPPRPGPAVRHRWGYGPGEGYRHAGAPATGTASRATAPAATAPVPAGTAAAGTAAAGTATAATRTATRTATSGAPEHPVDANLTGVLHRIGDALLHYYGCCCRTGAWSAPPWTPSAPSGPTPSSTAAPTGCSPASTPPSSGTHRC